MKKGPEKNEKQKQAGLHQFNVIAEQMIAHLTQNNNEVLKAEGFIRLSGNVGNINKAYNKVKKDPSQFTAALVAFTDPHDKAGLFKRVLNEVASNWTAPAQRVLAKALNSEMNYQDAVTELIQEGATEEAKALHNILYISRLITSEKRTNMMGNKNVAVVLGNYLLPSQDAEPAAMLSALPKVQQKFVASMTETFNDPFEAVYPELNTQLEGSGIEISDPISPTSSSDTSESSPTTFMGVKVPSWAVTMGSYAKDAWVTRPGWLRIGEAGAPVSFKVGEPQNVKHVAGSGTTTQSEQQSPTTGVVKARVAEFEKMNRPSPMPPVASSTATSASSGASVPEATDSKTKWRERATALIDATRTLLTKAQGVLATGVGAAVDFMGKNATRFGKFASEQWVKRPSWLGGKPIIKSPEEPITPPAEKSPLASSTPAAVSPIQTSTASAFDETWKSFTEGRKAEPQGAPMPTPLSPQAQERKDKWIDTTISQLSDDNPNQGFSKLVTLAHESLFSKYLVKDYEVREVFEILRGAIREDGTRHFGPGIDVEKIKAEYRDLPKQEMTERLLGPVTTRLLGSIKDEGKRDSINKFIVAVVEAESTAKLGYGNTQDQKRALGQVYDALQGVEKSLKGEDKRPKPFAPQNGQAASSVTRTGSTQERVVEPGSPQHRNKKQPH